MKLQILLFLFIISNSIHAQEKFLNIIYDRVVMYEYGNSKSDDLTIVSSQGIWAESISAHVTLDYTIIKELNRRLTDKKSFGGGVSACYEPHLGFVYFLKEKIVGKVDICLRCNILYSTFELEAQKYEPHTTSQGETFYTGQGMSIQFGEWLNELIKSKGFKYVLN